MQIVNKTSSITLASCGSGGYREIHPGCSNEIFGRYLGKMSGRDYYDALPGVLICKEESDGNSHQVTKGNPLRVEVSGRSIIVCHYLDAGVLVNHTTKQPPDWDQK